MAAARHGRDAGGNAASRPHGALSARLVLPPHADGMRIGLFGGSFNPPHAAHREASLFAIKRLGLDRIWWLITPGNPLKDTRELSDLDTRMTKARALSHHPRIDVCAIETQIGTRFSADTIAFLRRRCPRVEFVWLMGADNLAQFHQWRNWRQIADMVPLAVIDRPGSSLKALAAPAARALARYRLPDRAASALAGAPRPAWIFLHGMKSPLSSTQIRNRRKLAD